MDRPIAPDNLLCGVSKCSIGCFVLYVEEQREIRLLDQMLGVFLKEMGMGSQQF